MKKIFTFLVVLVSTLSVLAQDFQSGDLLGRTTSATEPNLVEVVAAGDQASVFTSSPVCYIPCGTLEKYEASAWVNQVSEFVVEECDDAGVGGGKSIITYTSTDGNTVTPKAGAFGGANIVSNTYADGVGTIAFDAVVTEIGDDAFAECHTLATVVLPEGVIVLRGNAFEACENLVSVSLPEGLKTIGMNAFLSCDHLASVVIPNSVTSVGINAFNGCSALKSVVLSENLQEIESGLFNACESLDYIVIPSSVTSIAKNAFYGCVGLDSIRCMSIKPAELANKRNVFYGMEKTIPVYVPCIAGGVSSVEAYQAAWGNYFNNFQEPRPIYSVALSVNNDVMGTAKIGERNTECGVEIVAVPNTGYEFVEWADGNKLSTRTLVLESDSAMQAIFKPIRYTITAVSADAKHGTAVGGEGDYNTEVKISATPKFGYRFNYWDDGNQDNPRYVKVTGDATYVAQFKEALVKDTIEVSVCDNTTYEDPITGEDHEIKSATPASLTWNDSVWGALDQKDTLYTFVVTPLVAPKLLEQADLEDLLGAVPVLVPGYEPDTTASVAAILKYYQDNDDEKTADVVSVKWNYSGKVKCDDTSFAMALIVKDTCGKELKTACDFVVKPTIVRDTLVAETCESYKWAQNDSVYTKSGKYVHVDTTAAGCDSVYHVLDLTVWGNDTIYIHDTICPGTVALNGELLYKDTALTTIGTNNHGCPEVTIKHWHVYTQLPVTKVDTAICYGDTLEWLGEKYWYPVEVNDTLSSQYGCDSVIYLNLQVWKSVPVTVITDTICEGEKYVWNLKLDTIYTESKLDTVVLSDKNGCDSVVILDLTVMPKIAPVVVNDTTCFGVPYKWDVTGKQYTGTCTVDTILSSIHGCDSVVRLNLVELPEIPVTEIDTTICYGKEYYSQADEKIYTSSVDTTFVLKTVKHGCDSLVHLVLTVLPEVPMTVVDTTICYGESFLWDANGETYTQTTLNKTVTLPDAHGCDSLVTLNLTVLPEVKPTVIDTVTCYGVPFFWSLTGKYYSHSQVVDTLLIDAHGCDSLVRLNLVELAAIAPVEVYDTTCYGVPYTWDVTGKEYAGTCTVDTLLKTKNGCDSLMILHLTELPAIPVTEIDTTIIFGKAYYSQADKKVYTSSVDTTFVLKTVKHGCDSLVHLNLTVLPAIPPTVIDTTICAGESYYWTAGDTTFTTSAKNKRKHLTDAHGCDSLVILNLTVLNPIPVTVIDTVTCHGVPFFWSLTGKYYSHSQVVDTILTSVHGCDSVVSLHLTELPKMDTTMIHATVCHGEPYVWDLDGEKYFGTQTIDTILPSVYGCDSVVILSLVELPAVAVTEIDTTICFGEAYYFEANEKVYTESKDTIVTLKDVNGCDSLVRLNLTVLAPIPATVVDTTICHGETYYWAAGDTIFTTPVYGRQVTVSSAHGCDSLVVLNLTILPEVKATVTDTVTCHGESFFWAVTGQYYSGTQVVDTVMQDIHGCDSVVRLNLVELPKMDTTFINDTTCFGVPYKWDVTGKQYTGSCTVDTILSSIHGCDSVVRLNLVEMPEILPVVTKDTICAGEPFSWRGTLYNTTGTYNDTVVTAEGCDSIYTLMLQVWPAVAPSVVYDTICYGESYEFGEAVYTESVTTTYTFNDIHGCDSVVTLMLYVWPENRDSVIVTEYLCHGTSSFLWDVNNVVYTKDTLAKAVLQDVHGCDSVVFLNLVSLPLITDTVVETICYGDSVDWFGNVYKTTGMYNHTLTSVVNGCDSIAVLNLTVLPEILPEVTNGSTCAGVAYEWRGKAYTEAGTYTDSVKTENGCDSVYVLNLQVWPAVAPTEVYDTVCAGETYTYNGETYITSIVKDVTLTSVNGCDSIVRLNLHVLPENKDSITVTEYLCYGEPSYVWSVTNEAYSADTLVRGVLPDVYGCDSVVFLNLVALPLITDTVVETICYGDSVDWFGNVYKTTGMYNHTLTSVVNGCDSIAVLNLTVLPEILETVIYDTIYQGDKYNWKGVEYTDTDDYTRTFPSIHGCDSVVTLKLYVRPLIELVTTDTICAGDSYTWNEFVYTSTTDTIIQIARDTTLRLNLTVLSPIPDTVYNVSICEGEEYTWFGVKYTTTTYRRDTLHSVHGCDSVSVLNLTVWPKHTPITFVDTICHGETYEWEGDVYNDSVMVTKTLTDIHGCDSIVTLKLAVLPPVPSTEETVVACDTYTWHEKEYTMTGDYVDTIPSATGCDSIVTLHLTINYSAIKHLYDTVCDTYTWYTGDVFTKTGIYYDTLATEQGCDSVVALHLTVNHRIETEETIAICHGESLTWNGVVYDATGDYQFDTLTVHGCDSIVTLHLTVLPEMRVDSTTLAVCPSELPYKWYDQTLTAAGEYTCLVKFVANNTCDSVLHVLNFEILPETSSDTTVVACDSYTWNGKTYDQSGDYRFITTGANGCDSVAHLHLTVNYSTETHDYQTICYGKTYTWNHTVYDAAGDYVDTLTTSLGCDSIVTLHLTILPEVENIAEEQVICPSELPYKFWRGYSLTESGLYYDTVANSLGCDSIIYALKLKVLPIDTTRLEIAACDSFTWDGTGQTYDRSGQWVYQVHGSDGCDSVVILDLTITHTIYENIAVAECVSYEWNGQVYTESGEYTYTTVAANGCDSIVTLYLTILKPSTGSEDVYICHGETYTWEGDVYDTSGEYVKTLTNAAGCDSTAHLYLTVLPEMTYEYHTLYVCAGDLPYEWNNLSLTESGEYTYREQFAANASCDSIEHVLTFTVYDMSLPDTISQPIAICGKPIDLMKATDQIESYIASISHYAPNATVVWQEWIDGVWVDYDYETLKGSQSEIIIRYAIITDCGVIYSDEMVLIVEQATPENSTELDNMSVESKYGNRIFLFDLNAFSSTFGWTPTPEQVSWYKVVGEVDVYGEMGDDELVGVGHSYNLPEGEVMVGGYYAIVEQHAVSVDDCETIYRSTVIYATASGIAPKLVPNVVYPDEVLTIKNLDESQIHQILVYGASGELIATYKADKVGEFMFNAANATGYYLVDIINTNGSTTLRYVVK